MIEDVESRNIGTPLIVRVAGLPISAIEPFSSELHRREMEACRLLQRGLKENRAELMTLLHADICAAPPEARRFLLSVKRDCFNGRSLSRYQKLSSWDLLQEKTRIIADRILNLEEQLAAANIEFELAYARECARERFHLAQACKNEGLMRGLTLASRVMVDNLQRTVNKPPDGSCRRARRLELSLLRYLSRTAVKLSPYSTLTRLGLGAVKNDLVDGGVRLQGNRWQERSLLRLKRYVLDQYRAMLVRYPPFRDSLIVTLNSTIEEIAPNRYRFLRPSYWAVDNKRGRLQFFTDSVVKLSIHGPLMLWLLNNLASPRSTYLELATTLKSVFAGEACASEVDRHIQELLDLGFLRFVLPWPSNEAHLEKRVLEHLRTLPLDDKLQAFIRDLDGIVSLECGYPTTADPVRSVEEIDRLIGSAWTAAAALGGFGPEVVRGQVMKSNFYEDVFIEPVDVCEQEGEILQVPRLLVDEVLRDVEPLIRLKAMNSHRHDFLHTISAFMAQRWPGQREVGLIELFNEIQPLWSSYLKYDAASRRVKGWKSEFNPLSLPSIARLHSLREKIWSELASCVHVKGDESWLYREELWALLDRLPKPYLPAVGACLFLQSARADGSLWVLNRIAEGVGRFGSRFTPAMDDDMRRRYTDRLTANSIFEREGRRVELLDILCTQGDTLNVHPPQTARILEIPGENSDLPDGRSLELSDIRVLVNQETQLPEVVDCKGQYLLPVHLGGASHIYMPSLFRFICLFGPGEGNPAIPAAHHRDFGEMKTRDRMTVGSVVLKRKRWIYPPGTLSSQAAASSSDCQFFNDINQWREKWGIPERVFLIERVHHELLKTRYKPQYLDFTSPLMVAMLRASLKSSADSLVLEEMLPSLEAAPFTESGERWAVELLLDTIALEPGDARRPRSTVNSAVFSGSSAAFAARDDYR